MLRLVGQGSFASVVHARHEAMDRDVALKFLRPDVMKSHPEVGERFLREVRLASRLTNPRTVTIFDFGETEEAIPYMVLEYVRGRPLDYAIEKYGGLGFKRAIRLTLQILESLEEAHDHRIIHRDLKPANIMLAKRNGKKGVDVKVLDFGVAKLVEQSEEGRKSQSGRQSTQFIGTPRYMSPEQILGQEVRPASDLYSLGLIFYEMCTGEESVPNTNVAKVAQLHLDDDPLDLPKLRSLPEPLREVILTATARHARDRYGNAAEFRAALEEALESGRAKHREATKTVSNGRKDAEEGERTRGSRNSDVFSGEGYLAPPDEEELAASVSPTGPGVLKGGIRPGRRSSSPASAGRPPTPGGKKLRRSAGRRGEGSRAGDGAGAGSGRVDATGELELDMDSMRAQKRERAERRRAMQRRKREERRRKGLILWRGLLSIAVVIVAGMLGFVIVGGSLQIMAWPMRFAMALLPIGLALLWALFSESAYPDVTHRVLIPFARRSLMMVAISLVLLSVVMPGEAARSLRDDGLWFMLGWPESLQTSWIAAATESICNGAAWVMDLLTSVIPWSK